LSNQKAGKSVAADGFSNNAGSTHSSAPSPTPFLSLLNPPRSTSPSIATAKDPHAGDTLLIRTPHQFSSDTTRCIQMDYCPVQQIYPFTASQVKRIVFFTPRHYLVAKYSVRAHRPSWTHVPLSPPP
jgi:hypothetical protein